MDDDEFDEVDTDDEEFDETTSRCSLGNIQDLEERLDAQCREHLDPGMDD